MTVQESTAALFFDVGDLVMIRVADPTGLHECVPTRGTGYIAKIHADDWLEVRVLDADALHIYRPEELVRLAGGTS